VYLVTAFDIPPGAVLSTLGGENADANWVGIARIGPREDGFDVLAYSIAPRVILRTPTDVRSSKDGAEGIDLAGYSQVLRDPNIIEVQFFAGAFVVILHYVLSIVGFIYGQDKSRS
jgi:hypothetical protein